MFYRQKSRYWVGLAPLQTVGLGSKRTLSEIAAKAPFAGRKRQIRFSLSDGCDRA